MGDGAIVGRSPCHILGDPHRPVEAGSHHYRPLPLLFPLLLLLLPSPNPLLPAPGGHQACRPGCELPADRALGWFLEASNPSSCQLPLNEFHQRLRSCGLRSDWVRLGSGPKCRQSAGGWPLSTGSYELGRRWRLTQGPRRSPCREGPLERPLLRGFPPRSYPDPQTT